MSDDYLTINRANWDARAPLHAASPDYDVERAVADPDWISDVVAFDRPHLGDLTGLDVAHLQCHIGTDTLSLHRLGARVTGLDFSQASLDEARRIAARAGADIPYVRSDVYDAPAALGGARFDLVYTSIGVLGWLPRIEPWARAVAGLLRPGGRLYLREGHPVLFATDEDSPADRIALAYPYFEQDGPLVFDNPDSYVRTDAPLAATTTHEFQHGLGEILTAVLGAGMRITRFVEHDTLPWLGLRNAMRWDPDAGAARLLADAPTLPLSYTLEAVLDAPAVVSAPAGSAS